MEQFSLLEFDLIYNSCSDDFKQRRARTSNKEKLREIELNIAYREYISLTTCNDLHCTYPDMIDQATGKLYYQREKSHQNELLWNDTC